MPKIKINQDRCKGCQLCIKFCPKGLLKSSKAMNKKGLYPAVFLGQDGQCIGCGLCAMMCPDACIEIEK